MVEHVGSARAPGDPPSRPAIKFPLWAGDVPIADADFPTGAANSNSAPQGERTAGVVTRPTCGSISDLAAARRRATPPPLPKAAPALAAPPIAGGDALAVQLQDSASLQPAPAPSTYVQRVQELPCWLTSLVLHLCLVILLNSYVIYSSGTNRGGISPQGATVSLSRVASGGLEFAPDADLSLLPTLLPDVPLTDANLTGAMLSDGTDSLLPPDIHLQKPPGTAKGAAPPQNNGAAEGVAIQPAAVVVQGQTADHSRRHSTGSAAESAAPTTRAVPSIDSVPTPDADFFGAAEPDEDSEQANDDIVDRFIAYDLGQLAGAAAARAHRDFQSLGASSIPSLVRGLNRAAQIRGTCPVMVLSAKLDEMLRQTNDPSLIRYAFENLGRGVPAQAAHAQRITTLRNQLLARQKQQVAIAIQLQGITTDDVLLSRLAPLFTGGADRLNKALGDSNGILRQVAAMQIETRFGEFSELERRRLARSLIRLLRDPRPEAAAAAHSALKKLGGGDDFGPAPQATPSEVAEAARDWSRRFVSERDVSDERVAKSLLTLAKSLQQRGRTEAATQRYQDILERFPDSTAATEAQHQLDSLEAPTQ